MARGGEEHQAPFLTKTLADGRRAQLMEAVRKGEQFDVSSGLPVSELRQLKSPTWFEHARAYACMKWPDAAAKHRVGIAEAMTNVTMALVTSGKSAPDPKVLRLALRSWAFQMTLDPQGNAVPRMRAEQPPAPAAQALEWMASHSLRVSEVAEAENLRRALAAISRRLNGKRAADNTIRRKRAVLSNALRYAVECDTLPTNPLPKVDWDPPQTDDEVDFQYVPGPELARRLLDAVQAQGSRGEHLHAFFGCMYYAAMRPSEVAALSKGDCKLPSTGWGSWSYAGAVLRLGPAGRTAERPTTIEGSSGGHVRPAGRCPCRRRSYSSYGATWSAKGRLPMVDCSVRWKVAGSAPTNTPAYGTKRGKRPYPQGMWVRRSPRSPTHCGTPASRCGSKRASIRWKWPAGPATAWPSSGSSTRRSCEASSRCRTSSLIRLWQRTSSPEEPDCLAASWPHALVNSVTGAIRGETG